MKITQGFGSDDGGDFTLRSQDSVDFIVHSIILSLASPVFKDLMSMGTGERLVSLSEDARTIRLMLDCLYSQKVSPINNYDRLVQALEVARKYELDSMSSSLRSLFWQENSPLHMRHDPLAAYEIASAFELEDVAKASYRHCIKKIDLSDIELISKIIPACRYPRYVLPLIARLARRRTIIAQLLSDIHEFPMNLLANEWGTTHMIRDVMLSYLLCEACQGPYSEVAFGPVSWQSYWAHQAAGTLLRAPVSECGHVFKVGFLCRPYEQDEDTTMFCEKCFSQIQLKHHRTWEDWAQIVKLTLKQRLDDEA